MIFEIIAVALFIIMLIGIEKKNWKSWGSMIIVVFALVLASRVGYFLFKIVKWFLAGGSFE